MYTNIAAVMSSENDLYKNFRSNTHHFHIDHNAPCLPPKFCMTIVSSFSWVLQLSHEKSKTVVMQNLGGGRRFWGVHYGLGESGEYTNFDILKFILGCEAWRIKQKISF